MRAEIKDAAPPAVPAAQMVLGIDGCFVKGISRNRKTSLEIVLGQIEVPARNGEVFAVVFAEVRMFDDELDAARFCSQRWPSEEMDELVAAVEDNRAGMLTLRLSSPPHLAVWTSVEVRGHPHPHHHPLWGVGCGVASEQE